MQRLIAIRPISKGSKKEKITCDSTYRTVIIYKTYFEVNMPVDKELLDILACPKCKGDIRLNESKDGLICDSCKLLYHIKDDIPVMLIDEAEKL